MSSKSQPAELIEAFTQFVLETLASKRAENVVRLDISELSHITDEFMIATVTSTPQARAIVDACEIERKKRGLTCVGIEGASGSSWVVLDYGDFVVHMFTPEAREFYGLEHLWADAKRLD